VHTGLGIVQAMTTLNTHLATQYRVQLAVRLGIHTGPVVVGVMGGGWTARVSRTRGNPQHRGAAPKSCPGQYRGDQCGDGTARPRDFCLGRAGNPHTARGCRANSREPCPWPPGDVRSR
jgi:hypothetical protein